VATKKVFDADLHSIGMDVAWFGLIAFTLQIYFDFSGYTDMAIGLGKILGFKLPENFNYPYISRSISDFWRRWHMTLTSWFRNYLFTPLEFARKKVKHFRQQSDIFIVFLLTGLWHGASWNFLIWGGYFGLILALEASGFGKKLKTFPRIIQHFYASLLIMIGWIFFRLTDVKDWGPFFGALVGANSWSGTTTLMTLNVIFFIPLLMLAVFLSAPWLRQLVERFYTKAPAARIMIDILYLCLFILTVGYLLSNGYAAFMYGEF
jgi:alginate O-acetyltransferase complex protein AlgI